MINSFLFCHEKEKWCNVLSKVQMKCKKTFELPDPDRQCDVCVTELAVVVHQNDLMQQVDRRPVQHAVDGPEQSGERLVEETDHNTG